MSPAKRREPAVDGWLRIDAPALLGTRCRSCKSYFFPPEAVSCRNPACGGAELESVELSRRGRLWSFTNNCYAPPAPYVAPDPFEPYAIAAVELERERMVVLGQVARGVELGQLRVGMEMEIDLGTLFEDGEREVLVWNWRPAA